MFFPKKKKKQFHLSKVSFQKRFSSSDYLNVITTNINIYFDCILAKTRRKNGHHKAVLWLHACLLISDCICLRKSSQIAS